MDVASVCPLRVASLLWQPRAGIFVLTVIAKATYELAPGVSPLAERQEDPNEDDNHWNDDPSRSLYAPSDLAPFKPRADVVLVGHAFALRGTTARSLVARLAVAGIDKSIEVWTERTVGPDGVPREGSPFGKLPLRYERAAAGAGNPVGIRPEPRVERGGSILLPNLQVPGLGGGESIKPIGFGPIAPTWPPRGAKLPRHLAQLSPGWSREPMPDGLDPSFFNVAPPDQQVERLRSDETIFLENLHPDHPQLLTRLARITPNATVQRGTAITELPMNPDTLWIDTDRSLCTLTWRVQIRLEQADAAGQVRVGMSQAAQGHQGREIEIPAPAHGGGELAHLAPLAQELPVPAERVLPAEEDSVLETRMPPLLQKRSPMPFRAISPEELGVPPAWLPPPRAPATSEDEIGETLIVREGQPRTPALPFGQGAAPAAPVPSPAPATPSPQDGPSPPALIRHPSLSNASPPVSSPYAAPAAPPPRTVGQAAQKGGTEFAVPSSSAVPEPVKPLISSVAVTGPVAGKADAGPRIGSVSALRKASFSPGILPPSAGSASNAAAEPREPAAQPAAPAPSIRRPHTSIELLWYDPTFVAKLRQDAVWDAILTESRQPGDATPKQDKKPQGKPAPERPGVAGPQDREDIAAILAIGTPAGIEGLPQAITDAIDERGSFHPPLLLLGGELEFPFDELETLKATVAAVTPLAAGDKKVKETIDTVGELLRTPWLQAAGSVTERLTAQVKEAFAAGNRLLPPGYLELHTERILLEQRHYQRRTLLGQVWIRALLVSPGSSARVPTYLPHALARELPMFQRFPVRMIAEVRVQADQYESHPSALRVVALGRVLGASARR